MNPGGVSDQIWLKSGKSKDRCTVFSGDKQSVGLAENLLSRPANQRGELKN